LSASLTSAGGAVEAEEGLDVRAVSVRIGGQVVLDRVDLVVPAGTTLAVCGPSGCGKTTLLRVISGLVPPDGGAVRMGGADLANVPPHRRRIGMMFQDHALFPHRTVGENVAFGLRMAGMAEVAQRERVGQLLHLVDLAGYERRSIESLSGGEAQRVALARALAPEPALLLLDEPLGSLDRVLREELAGELRRILRSAGTTAVHVTHDQDEAASVADRLAVMLAGTMRQIGEPGEVRRHPVDATVARFLGVDTVVTGALRSCLGIPGDRAYLDPTAISLVQPAGAAMVATIRSSVFRNGRFVHVVDTGAEQVSAAASRRHEPGSIAGLSYVGDR
jgi:thiamine transport system ATP-binding protein